jgi:cell division protein FtsW
MTTSIPRPHRRPDQRQPAQRQPTQRQPQYQPRAQSRPTVGPAAVVAVKRIFAAETGNYFLLLGATLFLVVLGLVMVLSSSAVESYKANDNFFTSFLRQMVFAALGLPLMLVAARMPASFWKKWAGLFIVVAIALQALVVLTPLGTEVNGNRNWITFGSFTAQPSELVKFALVIWIGYILSKKLPVIDNWRELVLPLLPVAGVAILLVLIGGDLGTTIILSSIVLGALFFTGVKLRYLFIPVVLAGIIGLVAAFGTGSRQERIHAFLAGCKSLNQASGSCYQTIQGWWALANGGLFGAGLGNSTAKWSWLPEADNDFIFAIIGNELGLIGAVVVLLLFVVIAIACVRIIRANRDPFARITTSAIMVWIIGQAFVNVAVVLGILPVLGVPLPLISAGGSALITSMAAIGIVLSFARHAPADDQAHERMPLRAGRLR